MAAGYPDLHHAVEGVEEGEREVMCERGSV
jgi:hypothetical protein